MTYGFMMKKHKKIIVWGAKYETGHTHAFTHAAFVKGAQYLNEEVYWLDDTDNVDPSFFDDSLIVSEHWIATTHPRSHRLPLRKSSTYVMNYLGNKKGTDNPGASYYLGRVGRIIDFRFANNWSDKYWEYKYEPEKYIPINDGVSHLEKGSEYDNFYSMWATDLMPNEINFDDCLTPWKEPKHVFFSGTIREDNHDQFEPFIRACNENKMQFYFNDVWRQVLTIESVKRASLDAFLALELRPKFHVDIGYKSCRAFKVISYGQLGMTNSRAVYDFFDQEIAFHEDPYQLFHVASEMRNNPRSRDLILNQMKKVKEKHTYASRMKDIITACEM